MGRRLVLARDPSHGSRSVGKSRRVRHPLRTKLAMAGVLQSRLTHIHIQQFHAHKSVDDFIEFPARHFLHSFSPGRAQTALAPVRAGRSLSNKMDRARLSLDLTVPTGHSSKAAASP